MNKSEVEKIGGQIFNGEFPEDSLITEEEFLSQIEKQDLISEVITENEKEN